MIDDSALLARVLTGLRRWGEPAGSPPLAQPRQTISYPVFGVSCRRASPTDPLIDITMPSNAGPPVACPPPLFRRPVGPIKTTSEGGSLHG